MCGIAGLYSASQPRLASQAAAGRMCDVLTHRGPDSQGIWADSAAGLVFGQRRLAVIDTSEAGLQPMQSASGRFVINYNGEIYNYLDVRAELEASGPVPNWRGHSDTETMLEAIDRWGLADTLARIEGQFAIALWDRQARRLYLARDRFGEKPLYYGWAGKALVFGSELKALRTVPGCPGEIDREALASFVRYGFVPHPRSIWRGISKLPPGTWTSFGPDDPPGSAPRIVTYWDAGEAASQAMADPWRGSESDAVEALDALLARTVKSRMIADVPLGAMLSGGVDSSTVVAMMQAHGQAAGPVKTFTLGFDEAGYDEAAAAKAVAAHLGTDHTELYVTAADALAVAPRLPSLYDEPFADASQIPTFLVSGLARSQVTVALSGDAGDEIFGGYNRYFHGAEVWKRAGGVPRSLRAGAAAALQAVSPDGWNRAAGALSAVLPAELSGGRAGEKIHKLAGVLSAADQDAYHQGLLSLWDDPGQVLVDRAQGLSLPGDHPVPAAMTSFAERAMYLDTRYYLPDDILAKVDRAAMGVSLEARAPFLDRDVFAFAWSLPMSMKIGGGRGKQVLRKVLDRYVPRALIDRPKQGFALPIGRWLRGELKDWGEALLAPSRLKDQGLFDPAAARRCWDEHQSGRRNWDTRLWVLLMAQAWLDEQRGAA
ncbi:asparagine synthase (glutamine-hydrolyzing) [Caulobacter ginsengisoli]|nr:asparagine synthase (glutamine-hydrolyzing) [Caulobacter ginsengisoli]